MTTNVVSYYLGAGIAAGHCYAALGRFGGYSVRGMVHLAERTNWGLADADGAVVQVLYRLGPKVCHVELRALIFRASAHVIRDRHRFDLELCVVGRRHAPG